jgi:hypothetical protein
MQGEATVVASMIMIAPWVRGVLWMAFVVSPERRQVVLMILIVPWVTCVVTMGCVTWMVVEMTVNVTMASIAPTTVIVMSIQVVSRIETVLLGLVVGMMECVILSGRVPQIRSVTRMSIVLPRDSVASCPCARPTLIVHRIPIVR